MMACAYNLNIQNANEGSHVFQFGLCYIVSFRTALATEQHSASQNKITK